MSDDFKNINDAGREPEDQTAENKKEETYTQGESFVMRSPQETAESSQKLQKPDRKEKMITVKKKIQKARKNRDIHLISFPLRLLRKRNPGKRNHRESQENWDLQQPVQLSLDWWPALYSRE